MIFSIKNKTPFQAKSVLTLPKFFAVIFFALQLSNYSPDVSQNFNSFEDLASQEMTIDSDGEDKDNYAVHVLYSFLQYSYDTHDTISLNKSYHSSFLKYSLQSRGPPQV